jgi:hypothetical protein
MDYGCFHQRFYGAISCFVGDNLPEKQRTMGFAMQSFLLGLALTSYQNYR